MICWNQHKYTKLANLHNILKLTTNNMKTFHISTAANFEKSQNNLALHTTTSFQSIPSLQRSFLLSNRRVDKISTRWLIYTSNHFRSIANSINQFPHDKMARYRNPMTRSQYTICLNNKSDSLDPSFRFLKLV